MVDTTTYQGMVLSSDMVVKALIGGVNRRLDRKKNIWKSPEEGFSQADEGKVKASLDFGFPLFVLLPQQKIRRILESLQSFHLHSATQVHLNLANSFGLKLLNFCRISCFDSEVSFRKCFKLSSLVLCRN